MSFEVSCSQCQGRLRVEQAGVVACPHCGAHLTVNAPADESPAAVPQTAANVTTPDAPGANTAGDWTAAEASSEAPTPDVGEQMPYLGDPPPDVAPDEFDSSSGSALDDEDAESVLPGGGDAVAHSPAVAAPAPTPAPMVPIESAADGAVVPVMDGGASVHSGAQTGSLPAPDSVVNSGASSSIIRRYAAEKLKGTVSRSLFVIVVSYSSAVTLAAIYLAFEVMAGGGSASQLESLPDVKPQRQKGGDIGMIMIPEDADMPVGHTLAIGETRRFGNLEVTPLRVARGPIQFEFFLGDESQQKPDGDEILQLWLRFRNVSDEQSIAPLESLVFRRAASFDDAVQDRANTFVSALSQKRRSGHRLLTYEWNKDDVWNLRGQNVDYEIPPGETIETYVPTAEAGVTKLLADEGPYIWRVHFRKGYSPRQYGVTTVIEVGFDKSDIVAATAPAVPVDAESAEDQS